MISDGCPIKGKIATVQNSLYIYEHAGLQQYLCTVVAYLWACESFWDEDMVQQNIFFFFENNRFASKQDLCAFIKGRAPV